MALWPVFRAFKNSRGSVLIVCFFALMLITMFTLTVGYTVRQKFQVLKRLEVRQKLRLVGEAGVQKAIYVLLKSRDKPLSFDALNQAWSRDKTAFKDIEVGDGFFSVSYVPDVPGKRSPPSEEERWYGLVDEERKIHVALVRSPEILRRIFEKAAFLNKDGAQGLVDAIRDWQDEDEDTFTLGAESRYYQSLSPGYLPRNDPLTTLGELQWIKGMKPEIYRQVRPYITLDSSGQVNLNTVSRTVLEAIGFLPSVCDKIVSYRKGPDKEEGTADDHAFDDLSTVASLLENDSYLNDNESFNLKAVIQTGILVLKSRFFSVYVTARLPYEKQCLEVAAIFDERGIIRRWEESFAVSC